MDYLDLPAGEFEGPAFLRIMNQHYGLVGGKYAALNAHVAELAMRDTSIAGLSNEKQLHVDKLDLILQPMPRW
jgi:hypothetical protein